MSPRDRLASFAAQAGFSVRVEPDTIQAVRVPCLLANRVPGTCTIEKSYNPASGEPTRQIGDAVHAVRITTSAEHDGRVYHADGRPIGHHLRGDGRTWSDISIRKGGQGNPEEDGSARDLVHRYAKQVVGAVSAAGYTEPASLARPSPLKIPNTFEARAAVGPVQDRIRDQQIAIIGLGGTGAYVLDLVAKTPVPAIHLLDPDHIEWHNLMRAPGSPTAANIESLRNGGVRKVDYYHSKYTPLREGIHPHAVRVDNPSAFGEFLTDHAVDFAFVCIDQIRDSDSPRQDVVYRTLSQARIPFIDSGVSITLEDDTVRGSVTTSVYDAGSMAWNTIPNARVEGDVPGYRNVQLPEVNALAASLAVMKWRHYTGQYVQKSSSFLHKFRLERLSIVTPD